MVFLCGVAPQKWCSLLLVLWSLLSLPFISTQAIVGERNSGRYAIVVTLAGPNKLAEYFEWSCRTIGFAADKFDMLVFHESNSKLKDIQCAKNVKFVDLGQNGLAALIVEKTLTGHNSSSETNREELTGLLSQVILNIPRYLIEVKPMTGYLFQKYLSPYSHWTYTDPDIVWGNISSWINPSDAATFDIITLAKLNDAGRLFIRGQFALHKNIESVNSIWKRLPFFFPNAFAQRVVQATRMLREKKSSDSIFTACFHSAEGAYSEVVWFSKVSVKIIGRGFDDFSKDAVVLRPDGVLMRAPKGGGLVEHLESFSKKDLSKSPKSYLDLSPLQVRFVYDSGLFAFILAS